MTYKEFMKDSIEQLSELYSYSEAKAVAIRVLVHYLGITEYEYMIEPGTIIPKSDRDKLTKAIEELMMYKPIQYLFGFAEFAGHKFNVDERVLIPRPETEELYRIITEDFKDMKYAPLRIMDACTGSGVLAHSLAAYFPNSTVYGCDISTDALDVARSQQISDNKPIFIECDILESYPDVDEVDIIVSNPPYVTEDEKINMKRNVLDFEPSLALFVPNHDPLKYYKALGGMISSILRTGGRGYFEINELFPTETGQLFESFGFSEVSVRSDVQDKRRFIILDKWF